LRPRKVKPEQETAKASAKKKNSDKDVTENEKNASTADLKQGRKSPLGLFPFRDEKVNGTTVIN
jgi:hypothetical protein